MLYFGISNERKAIYMEMEKQMLGKRMFAGPSAPIGYTGDFDQTGLLGSSLFITLVHIKP